MHHKLTILFRLAMLAALLAGLAVAQPARAALTVVRSVGLTGSTPTASDNDFTRIDNAIHAAASGDTIILHGVFDFTESFAAAAWALGHDGIAGGAFANDDYTVDVPANLNNITLTSYYLGAAVIQGPGDLPTVNLETFLQFYNNGTNQNWTISNLVINDFDLGLGLFCCNGSPGTAYNGFKITHNRIRLATDLNAVVAPADVNQNIAIHLAYGQGIQVTQNLIEIPGDGVSDPSAPADWWTYGVAGGSAFSSNVVLQSNTHGGAAYDDLLIAGNTITVLGAPPDLANPPRIIGLWENGHAHNSDVTVRDNTVVYAPGGDPALNKIIGFRITSHSSATTKVLYTGNTVIGANLAFGPMDAGAGALPVDVFHNTLTNVNRGFVVGPNNQLNLAGNRLTGSGGAGAGVTIPATAQVTLGSLDGSNYISGFAQGVKVDGGAATIRYSALTGNATGLLVNSGTASVNYSNISGNTTGVNNLTVPTLDATYNWWGSAAGPGGANNPASGPWNTAPYAMALLQGAASSTHEIGESGAFDANVTAGGLYGAQLYARHHPGILGFTGGVFNNVLAATPPWAWDLQIENFLAQPNGVRASGSMVAPAHTVGANLSGQSIATWNYTCNTPGASSLMWDVAAGTGTYLSDLNGFQINAALLGDAILCKAVTASAHGYIKLQGRLGTNPSPAGWNDAVVILTCASGACAGYGPYQMVTDSTGHYQLVKTTPGSGIVPGRYTAEVYRRAYLPAAKASPVDILAPTTTIDPLGSAPTLLGGDVTGDYAVGLGDLTAVGGAFASTVTADTGNDINGDGYVNIFDLVMVGSNYGQTSSTWP